MRVSPCSARCVCVESPVPFDVRVKSNVEFADLVFLGHVTAVRRPDSTRSPLTDFRVTQWWKGGDTNVVTLTLWGTDRGELSCDSRFAVGDTVLVFARRFPDRIHTTACSGTKKRPDADSALTVLGPGRAPRARGLTGR
jgi:hypothetical protein